MADFSIKKLNLTHLVALTLFVLVVLVIVNSVYYVQAIWYVVDALAFATPLVYAYLFLRQKERDWLVLAFIWIPAIAILVMAARGLLDEPSDFWLPINMTQVAMYGYAIAKLVRWQLSNLTFR